MNGKKAKRLRLAAAKHFIQNNMQSEASPDVILKRTYKVMKKMAKDGEIDSDVGHSAALQKVHEVRTDSRLEKHLDPENAGIVNAANLNELEGVI